MMHKLIAAAVLACGFAVSIPEATATDVTLDGYGYYQRSHRMRYYGSSGKRQSGRYRYLGSDYYRSTQIGIDYLTNRSNYRSGSLSFEFWAMPYYGATDGIVLMTLGTSPLYAGQSKGDFHATGYAISLETRRYPELNIWEYTRDGWGFRDALSFTRKKPL